MTRSNFDRIVIPCITEWDFRRMWKFFRDLSSSIGMPNLWSRVTLTRFRSPIVIGIKGRSGWSHGSRKQETSIGTLLWTTRPHTVGRSAFHHTLGLFGSVCGKRIYSSSSCLAAAKISSRSAGLSAARASTTAPTIKAIETIAWSRPRSRFANPSRECSSPWEKVLRSMSGTATLRIICCWAGSFPPKGGVITTISGVCSWSGYATARYRWLRKR